MGVTRNIEVEMEAAAFNALSRLPHLDEMMLEPIRSARSTEHGFVVLSGGAYAFERLAGECAYAVNHAGRWTDRIELLNEAAECIEYALRTLHR